MLILMLIIKYDENITFSIGARNLLGQEPPLVYDAFAQNFDFAWDIPGGAFIYAGFKIKILSLKN